MSDLYYYANPVTPSYSGVTINIANPAVNMPPYGLCRPDYTMGMYQQATPNSFNPACEVIQNQQYGMIPGYTLPVVTTPYPPIQPPNSMIMSEAYTQQPGSDGNHIPVIYGTVPQNNYYGQPYYGYYTNPNQQAVMQPAKNADNEQSGGSYNSGTQNINTTNIYQTAPADSSPKQMVYPPQYYLSEPVNSMQSAKDDLSDNNNTTEEADTETSKEIITELDERQAAEKALEENGKKAKVVSLTNEYIMSLENYLNNPNTDIRLMAAKEILTRLDEDRSRYDDAALNALINKMLQDPNKIVRIAAMSALSSELASGNEYTVELLTKIQQNPEADPEDVLEASQILLKRASSTEVRYVPSNNNE